MKVEIRQFKKSITVALMIFFTMTITGQVHSRPDSYNKERSILIERAKDDFNRYTRNFRVEASILSSEYIKSENLERKVSAYMSILSKANQRAIINKRLKRIETDHRPLYKIEYEYYNSLYKLSRQAIISQQKKVDIAKDAMQLSKKRLYEMGYRPPAAVVAATKRQSARKAGRYCSTGICCPKYHIDVCTYLKRQANRR